MAFVEEQFQEHQSKNIMERQGHHGVMFLKTQRPCGF
jgi:hypothetical protein